jgi:hypothetical protein
MASALKHGAKKASNSACANDGNMFEMGVQINSLVCRIEMILITRLNKSQTIITL